MKKSSVLILLLLVMILAISAVGAADVDVSSDLAQPQATDDVSVDLDDVSEVQSEAVDDLAAPADNANKLQSVQNTEVIADPGDGNFTSLQTLINTSATTEIPIEKNYTWAEGDKVILIDKNVTLIGNNHKIDADHKGGIFNITSGGVLTLIGVTLVNANADDGGAIYNEGQLAVSNCTFANNTVGFKGGAVYNNGIFASIESSTFENNKATTGGAIYSEGNLTVNGATFENNAAELGGAIYVSDKYPDAEVEIIGSTFTENSACNAGGAIDIDATNGNGITYSIDDSEFNANYIDCDGTCSSVAAGAVFTEGAAVGTITGSNFTGNRAMVDGIPSNGGALKVQFGGTSTITDCTFTGNEAEKGGAIDAQSEKDMNNNVTVEGCTFEDNYATQAGGAICGLQHVGESTLTVKDSTFVNNAAGLVGGDIYADDLTIASITGSYFSGNDDKTNGIFNIYFYKLAEGSVVANNTFDIDLVNITTDKDTYAYGEKVKVSGDFDWGVNRIPINVTFALYSNGDKIKDIDTALTGTSFAEVLEGLFSGQYVVSVDSFTEDAYGNYYNITVVAAAEFVIEKANTTINVTVGENKSFAYGDNVTVFIELYIRSKPITANVTVVINDTPMVVEVINGTAAFNVTGFEPGNYALVGEFADDTFYNCHLYGSDVFTVLRPDRILSIETMDTVYDEPTFITIRVTDYEGTEEKGIVILNISGSEMAIVVNGTATVEFLPNATGLYLVNATLIETDLDAAVVNGTETFTVYDNPLVIIDAIANITITYGEDEVVIITPAYTLDLENIIEGNATIKVYNIKDLTAEVIENINNMNATLADIINYIDITADPEVIITDIDVGKNGAVVNIPGLSAGTCIMVMNFTSSNYYFGEAIKGFNILKATPVISVSAVDVTYPGDVVVTVTSSIAGEVTVTVGDKTLTETVEASVAKIITFKGLAAGEYVINATIPASQNYTIGVNDTVKVIVSRIDDYVMNITSSRPLVTENAELTVSLPENAAGNITVKYGDNSYSTIVRDGVAILTIPNLPAGDNNVTVIYSGDKTYASRTLNGTISVRGIVITANNMTRGLYSSVDYQVKVTDTDNNNLENIKVKFIIDGNEYIGVSNRMGLAQIYPRLDVGSYEVTVVHPITSARYTATATITHRIVGDKDLVVDYGSGSKYRVRIMGPDGSPAGAGVKVRYCLGGHGNYTYTDANGYVSIPIKSAPGTYKLIVAFKEKVQHTITVKHVLSAPSSVSVKSTANSLTLKATLKRSNGKAIADKTVKFVFNGKTYSAKTSSSGVAQVTVPKSVISSLKVGTSYKTIISFSDDKVTTTVKVIK